MFRAILVVLLVFGCATLASAGNKQSAEVPGYRAALVYQGIYKADRLYQFNVYQETWFASPAPRLWSNLPCADARQTLAEKGEWIGVLTSTGACSGYAEAPRWGTGNYLNFLAGGKPVDVSR